MDYGTRNERFEKERRVLDKIYELVPVGQEFVCTSMTIYNAFEDFPSSPGQFTRYVSEVEKAGVFTRRYTMVTDNSRPDGRNGKVAYWTLLVDHDKARALLQESQEARMRATDEMLAQPRKPRKPQGFSQPETTVAIVGPDAPTLAEAMSRQVRDLRKDETGALLEAARQYANRKDSAMGKLQELAKTMEELGIRFDADKAAAAMHFEEDERLETIALILPYVERLERVNEQLANQVAEMRPKVAKYDQLANENTRLSNRVERLVSQVISSPAH